MDDMSDDFCIRHERNARRRNGICIAWNIQHYVWGISCIARGFRVSIYTIALVLYNRKLIRILFGLMAGRPQLECY